MQRVYSIQRVGWLLHLDWHDWDTKKVEHLRLQRRKLPSITEHAKVKGAIGTTHLYRNRQRGDTESAASMKVILQSQPPSPTSFVPLKDLAEGETAAFLQSPRSILYFPLT